MVCKVLITAIIRLELGLRPIGPTHKFGHLDIGYDNDTGCFCVKNDVHGCCPIRREDSKMLQSNSSRHSYSLGDEVEAVIEKVEVFSQKIDLRLLK